MLCYALFLPSCGHVIFGLLHPEKSSIAQEIAITVFAMNVYGYQIVLFSCTCKRAIICALRVRKRQTKKVQMLR